MPATQIKLTQQVNMEYAPYFHALPPWQGGKVLKTRAEYVSIIVTGKDGSVELSGAFDTLLLLN